MGYIFLRLIYIIESPERVREIMDFNYRPRNLRVEGMIFKPTTAALIRKFGPTIFARYYPQCDQ